MSVPALLRWVTEAMREMQNSHGSNDAALWWFLKANGIVACLADADADADAIGMHLLRRATEFIQQMSKVAAEEEAEGPKGQLHPCQPTRTGQCVSGHERSC